MKGLTYDILEGLGCRLDDWLNDWLGDRLGDWLRHLLGHLLHSLLRRTFDDWLSDDRLGCSLLSRLTALLVHGHIVLLLNGAVWNLLGEERTPTHRQCSRSGRDAFPFPFPLRLLDGGRRVRVGISVSVLVGVFVGGRRQQAAALGLRVRADGGDGGAIPAGAPPCYICVSKINCTVL